MQALEYLELCVQDEHFRKSLKQLPFQPIFSLVDMLVHHEHNRDPAVQQELSKTIQSSFVRLGLEGMPKEPLLSIDLIKHLVLLELGKIREVIELMEAWRRKNGLSPGDEVSPVVDGEMVHRIGILISNPSSRQVLLNQISSHLVKAQIRFVAASSDYIRLEPGPEKLNLGHKIIQVFLQKSASFYVPLKPSSARDGLFAGDMSMLQFARDDIIRELSVNPEVLQLVAHRQL